MRIVQPQGAFGLTSLSTLGLNPDPSPLERKGRSRSPFPVLSTSTPCPAHRGCARGKTHEERCACALQGANRRAKDVGRKRRMRGAEKETTDAQKGRRGMVETGSKTRRRSGCQTRCIRAICKRRIRCQPCGVRASGTNQSHRNRTAAETLARSERRHGPRRTSRRRFPHLGQTSGHPPRLGTRVRTRTCTNRDRRIQCRNELERCAASGRDRVERWELRQSRQRTPEGKERHTWHPCQHG